MGTWVEMESMVTTKLPTVIEHARPSRFMPLSALSMLSACVK